MVVGGGGWLVELGGHGGSLVVELASRVVPHLRGERG